MSMICKIFGGLTIEVGITVNDDESPIWRETRAQNLSTSTSGISRSEDYNCFGRYSTCVKDCHSDLLYTLYTSCEAKREIEREKDGQQHPLIFI